MRQALKPLIAFAALTVALGGCATKTEWTRTVQPVRTLDEIYELQDRVNDRAQPYALGTGDAVGAHTTYQARRMAARSRER